MAREHGRSIKSVARDPYALTLWTFYQLKEAEYFASLEREFERIDAAEMVARGFAKGTQPIGDRYRRLVGKLNAPVEPESREELSRKADDLWAQHQGAMKSRPVS